MSKKLLSSSSMTSKVSPMFTQTTPSVWFSDTAWAKMWLMIDVCQKEVAWFGTVDELEDGDYLINDIYVPEQEVTGTSADVEPEALGKLAMELEAQGIDSSTLRYWGHSHVNMQVSPSGVDEDQAEEYLQDCDFLIRGIHNKKGESKVDVYDRRRELIYQRVQSGRQPIELTDDAADDFIQTIAKRVSEKTYVKQQPKNGNRYPFYGNRQVVPNYTQFEQNAKKPVDVSDDERIKQIMADPMGVADDFYPYY